MAQKSYKPLEDARSAGDRVEVQPLPPTTAPTDGTGRETVLTTATETQLTRTDVELSQTRSSPTASSDEARYAERYADAGSDDCCTQRTAVVGLAGCLCIFLLIFAASLLYHFKRPKSSNFDAATCDTTLIVIVFDGFAHYYLNESYQSRFNIATPNFDSLLSTGVHIQRLIPTFPSVTYPNHMTIATGMYPTEHGVVANGFYDPILNETFAYWDDINVRRDPVGKWFRGEAIWQTVQMMDRLYVNESGYGVKESLKSGVIYNPGSEASVGGKGYANYYRTDIVTNTSFEYRVNLLLDLVDTGEYNYLMVYFEFPDEQGHVNGPFSNVTAAMIQTLDGYLGDIVTGLNDRNKLNSTNLVLISDHGMTNSSIANMDNLIILNDTILLESMPQYFSVDYAYPTTGFMLNNESGGLTNFSTADLVSLIKASVIDSAQLDLFKIYRRDDVDNPFPGYDRGGFHNRIPDVFMVANDGYQFVYLSYVDADNVDAMPGVSVAGGHGYDPTDDNMGALFVANGPNFKKGYYRESVQNIHLYQLFCNVMCGGKKGSIRVKPANNSGDINEISDILL